LITTLIKYDNIFEETKLTSACLDIKISWICS